EALHGANRIATLKNLREGGVCRTYGGVIFRRGDRGDVEHLADLKQKMFMAVAPTSFGGWITAWRELKDVGIDPHRDFAELKFGGTHDAVVLAVRDGEVDAGTVRTDTLERMAAEGEIDIEKFKVIHEHGGQHDQGDFPFLHSTRLYPEWPLAKVEHTPDELAERVAAALLRMPADSPAAEAARCAGWTVPLNYQPVHECLQELRLVPYEDFGKVTLGDVVRNYWPWLVAIAALLALMAGTTGIVVRLNRKVSRFSSELERELSERKRAEEKL
ncbi:unnamed protein product, partial [marine sediment metagenome]